MIGVKSKQGIPTRTWGWITSFLWRRDKSVERAGRRKAPLSSVHSVALGVPPSFEGSSQHRWLGSLRRVLGNRAKHFGRSFCQAGRGAIPSRSSRGSDEILRGRLPPGMGGRRSRDVEQLNQEPAERSAERSQGVQWMPWHWRARKDARYCDKPRGAVSGLRSAGLRMGEPGRGHTRPSGRLGLRRTTPGTETSKYREEKKEKFDSESSGERNRRSPNRSDPGCGPPEDGTGAEAEGPGRARRRG